MKKLFSFLILVSLFAVVSAQTATLTFTGHDGVNNQYVQLYRVVVKNLSQNWQESMYWPDTTLNMHVSTGIGDVERPNAVSLQLSQNTPNPFEGSTYANLTLAETGEVMVEVTDITGRIVKTQNFTSLQQGTYQLHIALSTAGMYFLSARQNGQSTSIKMVNRGNGGVDDIAITNNMEPVVYESPKSSNSPKYTTPNTFHVGDQMEFIGYAHIHGEVMESVHVLQAQQGSEEIVLTFNYEWTDAQPCPGTPTVTDYDGNVYNTVMIGTQCWMKENMRATHYSNGDTIHFAMFYQESYLAPYYYNYSNSDIPLEKRGYLYNWPAAVHGLDTSSSVPSGIQGICPTGWHVPSWDEWDALRNYLGSVGAYHCGGCVECIAPALCDTIAWMTSGGNSCVPGQDLSLNNATGFSAIPAGYHWGTEDGFSGSGTYTGFWSTTLSPGSPDETGPRYGLLIRNYVANAAYATYFKNYGLSVRCLRD